MSYIAAINLSICSLSVKMPRTKAICQREPEKKKGKGKAPSASSQPQNPYGIVFRDEVQEIRYNNLIERKIVNTKYGDQRALEALGLYEDILWMFERIVAKKFFMMHPPTFIPLVLEFLSSLSIDFTEFSHGPAGGKIKFRLANEERELTLHEVRCIFGFSREGYTDTPLGFMEHVFWSQITMEEHFQAVNARASKIMNPCIRYAHRVLAHTVFGRGDSDGMVRQHELYLLWGMLNGFAIDVAYFMIKHMDKVARATRGAVVIGGLITPIAMHLGIEPFDTEMARGNPRLDIESCIAMKMIIREGDTFCLVLGPNIRPLPLPHVQKTTIRDRSNWKFSPSATAAAAFSSPLDSAPPAPTWGARGDPFGMESPPRDHPQAAGTSSQGPTAGFASHHDPGFQALTAQLYNQERRQGRMEETLGHIQRDMERLCFHMEDMGNFLFDRFGYADSRDYGYQDDQGGAPYYDPAETAARDSEATHSDDDA